MNTEDHILYGPDIAVTWDLGSLKDIWKFLGMVSRSGKMAENKYYFTDNQFFWNRYLIRPLYQIIESNNYIFLK